MTGAEELLHSESRASYSRFFLGIARKAREKWRDEMTGDLFGITEYLRCEGLLSKDFEYLARCEAAIRQAAEAWRA